MNAIEDDRVGFFLLNKFREKSRNVMTFCIIFLCTVPTHIHYVDLKIDFIKIRKKKD